MSIAGQNREDMPKRVIRPIYEGEEIAARIGRSMSYLEIHIRANPELRSLSLARPANRCRMEAK